MTIGRSLIAAAVLAATTPLHAADAYPSKAIRLIVPFVAGGTVDVVARTMAPQLSQELGQSIIIDNRGGAGGVRGADDVAKATPDGYTLLLSNVSLIYAPGLYKSLPFDVAKDFEPVSLVGTTPSVMVVTPGKPYTSLAAFTALAKAKPGSMNFGSAGNGSSSHLAVELYKRDAGVDVQHVPYRGGAPAALAVMSGEVQFMIETLPSVMPGIAGGKLKALAVTGDTRAATLAGIPTMKEAGLPSYVYNTWFGVWAPARTPPVVVARLNAALAKILVEPAIKAALARSGVDAHSSSQESFAALESTDLKTWTDLIHQAGIKLQ
jgi:tripartite-type tricarboxylate transporter receptor subunit TctC